MSLSSSPPSGLVVLEDWMSMSEDWLSYISMYGIRLVLCVFLSAVTIYRREISCNRVFHQDNHDTTTTTPTPTTTPPTTTTNNNSSGEKKSKATVASSSSSSNDNDVDYNYKQLQEETEELLNGAGMYCSGQSIFHLASLWLDCFPVGNEDDDNDHEQQQRLESSSAVKYKNLFLQEQVTPSMLLDSAGHYCSGEPILAAMALFLFQKTKLTTANDTTLIASTAPRRILTTNNNHNSDTCKPFSNANALPPDVHVHITSFLHPKDVLSLASVSKSYRYVIDHGEPSRAIWKTLWQRDYGWIIHYWNVGREAWQRSIEQMSSLSLSSSSLTQRKIDSIMDKEFYFTFGLSYLNYVLAGQNTFQRCLVGLHSQIYDITSFLDSHPGSPETLMVHAGKDSTKFFEDMGHSLVARRLAKKLCIVADMSNGEGYGSSDDKDNDNNNNVHDGKHHHGSWGLRPTPNTVLLRPKEMSMNNNDDDSSLFRVVSLPPRYEKAGECLQLGRRQRRRRRQVGGGTLSRVRTKLDQGLVNAQRRITQQYASDPSVLVEQVHPYYDPFMGEWRAWFTNAHLETVFRPC